MAHRPRPSTRSATRWNDRLKDLRRYKSTHGDLNVPPRYRAKHSALGRWVQTQRQEYRKMQQGQPSNLTAAQVDELNELGFVWSIPKFTQETTWKERLRERHKSNKARQHDEVRPPLLQQPAGNKRNLRSHRRRICALALPEGVHDDDDDVVMDLNTPTTRRSPSSEEGEAVASSDRAKRTTTITTITTASAPMNATKTRSSSAATKASAASEEAQTNNTPSVTKTRNNEAKERAPPLPEDATGQQHQRPRRSPRRHSGPSGSAVDDLQGPSNDKSRQGTSHARLAAASLTRAANQSAPDEDQPRQRRMRIASNSRSVPHTASVETLSPHSSEPVGGAEVRLKSPPQGEAKKQVAAEHNKEENNAGIGVNHEETAGASIIGPLVVADDRKLVPELTILVMSQVDVVCRDEIAEELWCPTTKKRSSKGSRAGSRGCGLVCRHCQSHGVMEKVFVYPLHQQRLNDAPLYDVARHLKTCTVCPEHIKTSIELSSVRTKRFPKGSNKRGFWLQFWDRVSRARQSPEERCSSAVVVERTMETEEQGSNDAAHQVNNNSGRRHSQKTHHHRVNDQVFAQWLGDDDDKNMWFPGVVHGVRWAKKKNRLRYHVVFDDGGEDTDLDSRCVVARDAHLHASAVSSHGTSSDTDHVKNGDGSQQSQYGDGSQQSQCDVGGNETNQPSHHKSIQIGDTVNACWLGEGEEKDSWFPGEVVGIKVARKRLKYHVIFDDGGEDTNLDGRYVVAREVQHLSTKDDDPPGRNITVTNRNMGNSSGRRVGEESPASSSRRNVAPLDDTRTSSLRELPGPSERAGLRKVESCTAGHLDTNVIGEVSSESKGDESVASSSDHDSASSVKDSETASLGQRRAGASLAGADDDADTVKVIAPQPPPPSAAVAAAAAAEKKNASKRDKAVSNNEPPTEYTSASSASVAAKRPLASILASSTEPGASKKRSKKNGTTKAGGAKKNKKKGPTEDEAPGAPKKRSKKNETAKVGVAKKNKKKGPTEDEVSEQEDAAETTATIEANGNGAMESTSNVASEIQRQEYGKVQQDKQSNNASANVAEMKELGFVRSIQKIYEEATRKERLEEKHESTSNVAGEIPRREYRKMRKGKSPKMRAAMVPELNELGFVCGIKKLSHEASRQERLEEQCKCEAQKDDANVPEGCGPNPTCLLAEAACKASRIAGDSQEGASSDKYRYGRLRRYDVYTGKYGPWEPLFAHDPDRTDDDRLYVDDPCIVRLKRGGTLRYFPKIMSKKRRADLAEHCRKYKGYRQYKFGPGGIANEPRVHVLLSSNAQSASNAADIASPGYKYHGIKMQAQPLQSQPVFESLSSELALTYEWPGGEWNIGCDVIVYRNGNDHIGWHSDDTQGEERVMCIVPESPGISRPVYIRPKKRNGNLEHGDEEIQFYIRAGDGYDMDGIMQVGYEHSLPKVKAVEGLRSALIFRQGNVESMHDTGHSISETAEHADILAPPKPLPIMIGHPPHDKIVEGLDHYSRGDLFISRAHRCDRRGVCGNILIGAESIVVSRQSMELREEDGLEWIKYTSSSRQGGGCFSTALKKGQPIRVFRSSSLNNEFAPPPRAKGQTAYRYDGLYSVRTIFDEHGAETEERPPPSGAQFTFLLMRMPKRLELKGDGNYLSTQELWEKICKRKGLSTCQFVPREPNLSLGYLPFEQPVTNRKKGAALPPFIAAGHILKELVWEYQAAKILMRIRVS